MTNILNLDDLVINRQVVLKGKTRTLNSMTVEQFIASDGIEERIKAAPTQGAQVEMLVEQIAAFLDDTTVEELKRLTVVQLFALLAFVRGTDSASAPAASAEGNGETPAS